MATPACLRAISVPLRQVTLASTRLRRQVRPVADVLRSSRGRRSASPPGPATSSPAARTACSSSTPGSCPSSRSGSTARSPEALTAVDGRAVRRQRSSAARRRPGTDSTLLVERRRYLGRGMREDLVVRNLAEEATYCKHRGGRRRRLRRASPTCRRAAAPSTRRDRRAHDRGRGDRLQSASARRHAPRRARSLRRSARRSSTGRATVRDDRPAARRVAAVLPGRAHLDGEEIEPRYRCGQPVERATPAERLAQWRRDVPGVETDHAGLARGAAPQRRGPRRRCASSTRSSPSGRSSPPGRRGP